MHLAKKEEITEIVKKIIKIANPELVILFGSYVNDKVHKYSDLDFLIVTRNKKLSRKEKLHLDYTIRKELYDTGFPIDLIIKSLDEIKEWREIPGSIVQNVLHNGKVLYEREEGEISKSLAG